MTSDSNRPSHAFPGWVVLLGVLTATGPLAIDMYLPSFTAIATGLNVSSNSVALTLVTFFIGLAFGQLVYGPVSDRFGRKPPLYFGMFLYVIGSIGCYMSDSVLALTIWRLVEAFGACAGMVIPRAIVRDRAAPKDAARIFSMLMLVMGLAPILAPLLGGWILGLFGWRAIFLVLTIIGSLCFLMIYLRLDESHDTTHEPPLQITVVASNYYRLFASRSFVGYTLSGGLAIAGMFAYVAGSPFIITALYEIPPQHFGLVFGLNAIGLIGASQLNAYQLKRNAPTRLLRNALRVTASAGGGMLLLELVFRHQGLVPFPLILIALFLYVASIGYVSPNSSASALATHGQQAGTASALMGALQFGLGTLAGIAIGIWHDGSALPLSAVMAICGIGAWAVHYFLVLRPVKSSLADESI